MPPDAAVDEPEVILDIVFEDGLLFAAVRNISARPAYRVSIGFDKGFTGLGGAQETEEARRRGALALERREAPLTHDHPRPLDLRAGRLRDTKGDACRAPPV